MLIRNFKKEDIKPAIDLSRLVWGYLYKNKSKRVQELIYGYTFEYYNLNNSFSFSAIDEKSHKLKGFLLASCKADYKGDDNFDQKIKNFNEEEKKVCLDFYDFLTVCTQKTKEYMEDDDIIMGLFVSIQKGCGKMLLSRLIQEGILKNKQNIYLWTDTTCDFDYYQKNNFELVEKIKTRLSNEAIEVFTYKKNINTDKK